MADKEIVDLTAASALDGSELFIVTQSGNSRKATGTQVKTLARSFAATARFLGRITSGAGAGEELTGTQATTLLDVGTSALKGLAPASGGGTTNFLRADFTWAAPAGGGGGASALDDLSDVVITTPATGHFLRHNGTNFVNESFAEAVDDRVGALAVAGAGIAVTYDDGAGTLTIAESLTVNTQTGSYTLVLGDAGKWVEVDVAGANNLTVPPNSSVAFAVGTQIHVHQRGAGQTTVVAGSGVTIRTPDTLKLRAQYSSASVVKRGTDEWVLMGDLETV